MLQLIRWAAGSTCFDIYLNHVKSCEGGGGDVEGQEKKGKVIKFGWIEGVYVSNLS